MSMDEIAYLAGDITLAWWAMGVILLTAGFLTWLVSWALENNTFSEGNRITWRKR